MCRAFLSLSVLFLVFICSYILSFSVIHSFFVCLHSSRPRSKSVIEVEFPCVLFSLARAATDVSGDAAEPTIHWRRAGATAGGGATMSTARPTVDRGAGETRGGNQCLQAVRNTGHARSTGKGNGFQQGIASSCLLVLE